MTIDAHELLKHARETPEPIEKVEDFSGMNQKYSEPIQKCSRTIKDAQELSKMLKSDHRCSKMTLYAQLEKRSELFLKKLL